MVDLIAGHDYESLHPANLVNVQSPSHTCAAGHESSCPQEAQHLLVVSP
jgi:hypothetical protein